MVTTSSLKALSVPSVGGDAGVWGNELNNTLGFLDTILGGSITFNSSGSATVTLTTSEAQYNRIVFSGTPASSMVLYFSTDAGSFGNYNVWNATSTSANGGAGFNVLCQVTSTSTGTTVSVPINNMRMVNVDGQNVQYADQVIIPGTTLPPVLNGYISGLNCSTGTSSNILSISAGIATDTTAVTYMQNATAFTKTASAAWASGAGNGGMGAGLTFAAGTTYHVFIISNGASSGIDFYFDTSIIAANKPANTNYFRRVASLVTTTSAALWPSFYQDGSYFVYTSSIPGSVYVSTNPGTGSVTATLGGIPTGINVRALLNATVGNANTSPGLIANFYDLNMVHAASSVPGSFTYPLANMGVTLTAAGGQSLSFLPLMIYTNQSAQIGYSLSFSNGNVNVAIATLGWMDDRGRK